MTLVLMTNPTVLRQMADGMYFADTFVFALMVEISLMYILLFLG